MKMPWRLILGVAIVSWILIELLDDRVGLRDARFITWAVVIPVGLWIAWRLQKDDELQRWAKGRGVEVTPSVAPELERYLGRRQKFGITGGLLVLSVAYAYDVWAAPDPIDWALGLFLVVPISALILAGQMIAERTFNPMAVGDVRRAELVARQLSDYVPGKLIALLRVLGAIALVVSVVGVAMVVSGDDATLLVVIGIAAALHVVFIESAQRWRAHWPRPFESVEATHLQDVLRADAIRMAMWGGIVATVVALTAEFVILARHVDAAAVRPLPLVGMAAIVISGIAAFRANVRGFSPARRERPVGSG